MAWIDYAAWALSILFLGWTIVDAFRIETDVRP